MALNLTANQCLNLLWIHHNEPEHGLEFSLKEIVALELEVVSRFQQIDSPYRKHLITQDKNELAEYLRNNSGKTIFKQKED